MDIARDHALVAEQAVLGSMLIDHKIVPAALGFVNPTDFQSGVNRQLFEAMRALYREGSPMDAIIVADKLGWSQDEEHRAYLAELLEVTPTSANWQEYAAIMHDQATLRLIRDKAAVLLSAMSVDECREPVTAITDAFGAGRKIEAWTLGQLLTDFADRKAEQAPKEYVTIGLGPIDSNTFLERGDVLMIGGAPSDGKTALGLMIAYHMAQRYNVGFYSLETGREKLEDRLVASGFQIDFDRIKKSALTEEDWNTFARKTIENSKRRLTVLRASGMTADQIASSSRARGFDVIFVDYVQLIKPEVTRGVSRAEQMAEVSRSLHSFAQVSNTLVVELAQLSRQERGSKRERDMFDLGESSQFEKDADLILLLYRPANGTRFDENDKYSEELDPNTTRILRVAKNKEGRRTRLPLYFDGAHQSFAIYEPDRGRSIARQYVAAGNRAKTSNRLDNSQMSLQELPDDPDAPF